MRNSRMKKVAVLGAATLVLLSGCGDAPYELTESEESMIVNYASQAVAKFNVKQKDGLTYVDLSELEEETEETETELVEETTTEEENQEVVMDENDQSVNEEGTAEEESAATKTLQEVFGTDGVSVTYVGYELVKNYLEEDYYAMEASAGKVYLVLNVDMTNTGEEETSVDILSQTPTIRVLADGVETTAEVTFLLNDFSTYQGVIPSGETVHTVLLFEVSDTLESVSELSLNVTINGEKVTIIL